MPKQPEHVCIRSDNAGQFLQELARHMWELERTTVMEITREVLGDDIHKLTPEQLIGFGFRNGYGTAVGDQMSGRIQVGAGMRRRKAPR